MVSLASGLSGLKPGRTAAVCMRLGFRLPGHVADAALVRALAEQKAPHVVLDSYPKTVKQARFLDTVVDVTIIYLVAGPSLRTRWSRCRARRVCRSCHANAASTATMCVGCGADVQRRPDDQLLPLLWRFVRSAAAMYRLARYYDRRGLLRTVQLPLDESSQEVSRCELPSSASETAPVA